MKKVAFIVDSSSGIKEGEYPNVYYMPLIINKNLNGQITSYKDLIEIDNKEVCELINKGISVSTSQPSPGMIIELLDKIADKYDDIFVLPIHEKLSSAINTWRMVVEDYKNVHVIPQYSLSRWSRVQLEELIELSKKKDLTEEIVKNYIESEKKKWLGFLIVPNVDQLVKGGRVSNFKGMFAKVLNLKLIITYDHNGLVFLDKASKYENCVKILTKAFNERINLDKSKIKNAVLMKVNYHDNKYDIEPLIDLLKKEYKLNDKTPRDVLPSVITVHTGIDYAAIIVRVE